MKRLDFLQNWLKVMALFSVVGGLFVAISASTPIFDIIDGAIDPVFLKGGGEPEFFTYFKGWVYGILGGALMFLGAVVFYVVNYGFPKKERWTVDGLTAAVFLWFIIEIVVSIAFGVYYNAVFAGLFHLLILIPLIIIRKDFNR